MNDTDPAHKELVWDAALSLAQLNQSDVADTILMLLNRDELNKLEVLDRETDPKNPSDRKSTRLNSSHTVNSYAVFCLKKKKTIRLGHQCCDRRTRQHVQHRDRARGKHRTTHVLASRQHRRTEHSHHTDDIHEHLYHANLT